MILTKKQEKLLEFVKQQHGDQVRKYTGEPYWNHCVEVAKLCQHLPFGIEIALCHDLLEDTECTFTGLLAALDQRGYNQDARREISLPVYDLTDHYTKEKYPNLNRKERKHLETLRLSKVSELAKQIKCADLIDNTKSIVEHDKGFAKVYLEEKAVLLNMMHLPNCELFMDALKLLRKVKKDD